MVDHKYTISLLHNREEGKNTLSLTGFLQTKLTQENISTIEKKERIRLLKQGCYKQN